MADRDDTLNEHDAERRIERDRSIAKHAAEAYGGQPNTPLVDKPDRQPGVYARITGMTRTAQINSRVEAQLVIENESAVPFTVQSGHVTISPHSAVASISTPYVAGPMSPALHLDAGDVLSLPVMWVIGVPGFYRLGAVVRLREKGAGSSAPLDVVETEPIPIIINPVM